MSDSRDYLPTAKLETLQFRARMLATARRFFDERGYWEVETPLLSHDGVIDSHLEPFVTHDAVGEPLYLQTSPEFGMKRLLVAGAEAIYQLGRVFRRGERGRLHNPEFTMIEWYKVGDDHHAQMQVVEELVRTLCRAGGRQPSEHSGRLPVVSGQLSLVSDPFLRTSYRRAFERDIGVDVTKSSVHELADLARAKSVSIPESLSVDDRDGWLNLLLAELVEPNLGRGRPEFVYDYPASQAALACIRHEDPPVAERFELYIEGIEICNGYHELIDPAELRARMQDESARRVAAGLPEIPKSNRLLAAMEQGLPACSGVALGFDRLAMLIAGLDTVADVIAFPIDRA